MAGQTIKRGSTGWNPGMILAYDSEKAFIDAVFETSYPELSEKDRKSAMTAVWKEAQKSKPKEVKSEKVK